MAELEQLAVVAPPLPAAGGELLELPQAATAAATATMTAADRIRRIFTTPNQCKTRPDTRPAKRPA